NPGFISGGKLKIEPLGCYSPAEGLQIPKRESTVVRRRNMDGLRLKIMTVVTQKPHQPFELYLTTPQNTHLDSVHRYNYGLMGMLKEFYNFTFVNRRTKSWGYLRNGKFDGMIGALSRREVDLGGSPMFFRQERHRVVSYTTRTFVERPCFIFRHPPRNDAVKNPFLLPFEIIVWYLMVGCGSILVTVFWFLATVMLLLLLLLVVAMVHSRHAIAITRPSQQTYRRRIDSIRETETLAPNAIIKRKRYPKAFYSSSEALAVLCIPIKLVSVLRNHTTTVRRSDAPGGAPAFFLVLFSFHLTGLSEIPHLSSGRCTSFFILLFGYLMYQYYSASIVGTLLMEQPKSIKTLRNLIDSRLTLGIEDIPYSRDYFVVSDCFISMDPAKIVLQKHTRTNQKNRLPHTPNYQRTTDADSLELHRTRIEYYEPKTGRNESNFLAAADGLQLVREGGYAFHVAISAAYRIIRLTFSEREICELSEIDMFPVWSQWMVAIVQKNSPYRDVITYGLRRLNEAGLMQRQRHVWQEAKPKCVRQIAPTDLIVGLDAVVSAFVLLCGGICLSVCVLFVEIL
ncbi:AGAP004923-PA, partial [Anopheles gambiae str. PEST]